MENLDCDQDTYRTVPHATFKAAMELLGLDVCDLHHVSIGNWTESDVDEWPWTGVLKQNGSFWRIRASVGAEVHGTKVRYVGIERRIHPEGDEG